jgi:trans-aconitate methyltransferase
MSQDYRQSHIGADKARSYHQQFYKNKYRSFIWNEEKNILNIIIKKYYNKKIRHLDFACGTGRIVEHLVKQTEVSVGVDVSEDMLSIARKNESSKTQFILADLTKEDALGKQRFNLITSFRFFPNAQDELRQTSMARLVSHLEKDGYLVFNNHKNYTSNLYRLARIVGKKDLGEMKNDDVLQLCESNNLKVIDTFHIGFIPSSDQFQIFPIWALRLIESANSKVKPLKYFSFNVIYVCKHIIEE